MWVPMVASMGMFPYEEKKLGVSLPDILFHICKSGQFYPNPTWLIPLISVGMDAKRVVAIWKTMMNPHEITMDNISNVFFATVMGVYNMRYFKAQEIVLDH
jgi:hypothetical protein